MRLRPRDIDAFLKKPDPAIRAVLIYGPDSGLVRERADTLAKQVVDDLSDPFRVVALSEDALKRDPAQLADEAAAISMMGGRRVIRIRTNGDALGSLFKGFLGDPAGDALILVEGGELGPRSSLRKAFEEAKLGAALPCYAETGAALEQVITKALKAEGLSIAPDALARLGEILGEDRGIVRQELEKLALYKTAMPSEGAEITLEDVAATIVDAQSSAMDALVDAVAGGELRRLDEGLMKAETSGLSVHGITRAVVVHFERLHRVRGRMDRGADMGSVIKSLRPPVHFSREQAFRRQLRLWPAGRIVHALRLLGEAEAEAKRTGAPESAVCGRALLSISRAAHAAGRRG